MESKNIIHSQEHQFGEEEKFMESKNIIHSQEHQFGEVVDIILQHRSRASRAVNEEMLLTAWNVGSYVSGKLKSEEWGSKVVTQLSEYIRSHRPDLKGYSRSSIYNMVMFYDEYSSEAFRNTVQQFFSNGIVQTESAQLTASNDEIVQPKTGQFMSLLNLTRTSVLYPLCSQRTFGKEGTATLYIQPDIRNTIRQ